MFGLHALCGFRLHRSFDTPAEDMFICGILEWGLRPFSGIYVSVSFVNTDWNWLFKLSAFSTMSVTRIPSRFRGVNPDLSEGECTNLIYQRQYWENK
jgi:hypothetical protein